MNLHGAIGWVEGHPVESVVIGGGAVLALLWIMGAFGGGSSSASAGASNLASAYYAAEAQQAVVGGQIQQATIAANQASTVAGLNANAAVAINAANAKAATLINGQNTGAASTINGQNVAGANYQATLAAQTSQFATQVAGNVAVQQSSDQLQATWSNNAALVADTASNNNTAATINAANNQTSLWQTILGSIVPYDQAHNAGGAVVQFGNVGFGVGGDANTPAYLEAAGYTPAQATSLLQSRGYAV
jgi:hypothetical protein